MFRPVELQFKGQSYTVPADNVWPLLDAIEEHVTFTGLAQRMAKGDVPRVKVCRAYAAALGVAGLRVGWQEVAEQLGTVDLVEQAGGILNILALAEKPADVDLGESEGKPKAGKSKKGQPKQPSKSG